MSKRVHGYSNEWEYAKGQMHTSEVKDWTWQACTRASSASLHVRALANSRCQYAATRASSAILLMRARAISGGLCVTMQASSDSLCMHTWASSRGMCTSCERGMASQCVCASASSESLHAGHLGRPMLACEGKLGRPTSHMAQASSVYLHSQGV